MSGKRKRAREKERLEAAPMVIPTEAAEAFRRQQAEAKFKQLRYLLFGNDETLWQIREPGFSWGAAHLFELTEDVRAALKDNGVTVPVGVDPLLFAARLGPPAEAEVALDELTL